MPSSYHRSYADSVSSIYRDMGRAKAEARLQQGQGWGHAVNQIGQMVANIPGQLQEQQQQKMRSELTALQMDEVRGNLARAKQQDAQTMAIANLVSQSTINGQFDKDAFSTAAAAAGMGQIVPDVVKTFADAERSLLELDNAKRQGTMTDAQLGKLQQDFLRPFALQLWENKFDPTVVNGTFAALRAMDVPEELITQWEAMPPEQMSLMVQQLLPRAQAPEPVTLSEGQVRLSPQTDQYGRPVMGPDGQPVMTRMAGNPKALSLDDQLAAAVAAKNGAEVSRLRNEMARNAAATRAPQQAPTPQYQRIETVDAAGNPVIQFMTPEEVRKQGGVMTSPKTTAKASGPATTDAVLGEIKKLSENINTIGGGPVANIVGLFRKGAAALNLDNDVAEYERLVTGFIPIMARSVGHSGVLTQQDVDSTKALFPGVTDNSKLSANLIARVERIMTAMQDPSIAGMTDATWQQKLNAAMAIANQSNGGGRASGAGPTRGGGLVTTPAPMSAADYIKKYGGG